MSGFVLAAAILLGRLFSLLVYQATWRNGCERSFLRAGSVATFLMRMRWWPLHGLWVFALAHEGWSELKAIQPWAVAGCGALAISAAGRLGAADLGRFFGVDRVIVLILAAGVWFSPVWVYPCVIAACCLQYTGAGWALSPGYSNLLGFEFLRASLCVLATWIAGHGAALAAGVVVANGEALAVAAVLGYQGSYYAHHALAKSALGRWIRENRAQYLPINAHLRGWCARGVSRRLLLAAAAGIGRCRVAVCAAVWGLEIGWLVVLADARVAEFFLLATVGFHVAMFFLTGLAGWQFCVSHGVMWCAVLPMAGDAFAPSHALAAGACALVAICWVGLVRRRILADCRATGKPGRAAAFADAADHLMAWWDGPCMRMFSWQGETCDGRRVSIPVTALSPYDTTLTDIHTHLMILGMHDALDPRANGDREVLRAGVWGILIDLKDRDFVYQLADGEDADPAVLQAPEIAPWSFGPRDGAPPEIAELRDLFLGINARVSNRWFRFAMRWPHFPGEDQVPDVCPLVAEVPPRYRFEVPLKSVSLIRIRTFQHRGEVRLLENAVVGTLVLE